MISEVGLKVKADHISYIPESAPMVPLRKNEEGKRNNTGVSGVDPEIMIDTAAHTGDHFIIDIAVEFTTGPPICSEERLGTAIHIII